jgi:hypothetical protein
VLQEIVLPEFLTITEIGMSDPIIAARLEIVSAKAKILAEAVRNGQTWPGDVERTLEEIRAELAQIPCRDRW